MKSLISVILFFLIVTYSDAQVCNEYRVSHVNDTINFRPASYSLTYTATGLPASRIYYEPGTQDIKFIQNYYYTGTRLDSLMGYVNGEPVGQIFTYDTSGNLTGIQNNKRFPYAGSTTLKYENNQLTSIHIWDLELKCSDIIYEGNSIKTASVEFYPYGGTQYNSTCTFLFDSLPNPLYNKIGIVDNPLLYLTPKTFLGLQVNDVKPYRSQNVAYYSSTNLITTIRYRSVFSDAFQHQGLGYKYGCISPGLFLNETLSISPNPSSAGVYKINLDNAKFKVYTYQGQLILENSNSLVDLNAQKTGIYLLHVDLPEGKKVVKLFKN